MSETENKIKRLQESREKSIPVLVQKFQKLVDETFEAVTQPLPSFEDVTNSDGDVVRTSEEILFHYIDVRNKALDNANSIMEKINKLEIELNAPEILEMDLKSKNESEKNTPAPVPATKSWIKKKTSE